MLFLLLSGLPGITLAVDSAKVPFDRLFTKYQERVLLNRANNKDSEISGNLALDSDGTGERREMTLKFNGYIKSENGKSQFWVTKVGTKNHKVLMQPQLERVRKIPIYSARKTQQMKPGQTWLINDNKVMESYAVPPERKPEVEKSETNKTKEDLAKPTVIPAPGSLNDQPQKNSGKNDKKQKQSETVLKAVDTLLDNKVKNNEKDQEKAPMVPNKEKQNPSSQK